MLLGDVWHAPFEPGSFDTIVTAWLIDTLPETLPQVAQRMARLLGSGGRWINISALPSALAEPDWTQDVQLPVPQSAILSEQALKQQVFGFIGTLVDGRRSTADIAANLVEKRLLPLDEAVAASPAKNGRIRFVGDWRQSAPV